MSLPEHLGRIDGPPVGAAQAPGPRPFEPGERIMLFDAKGRRYLVNLADGADFHSHAGVVPHAELIGKQEGSTVRSTLGARYTAVRPTLAEVVLKMPRGAQVIYPKDLGPILVMADIFPGARVLESGLGSGALSMALLRAGAHVHGYEIRADFAERAVANVSAFLGRGALSAYQVEVRDVYEGIGEAHLDRVLLDLPEPWRVVEHAATALRPGGILLSYLPTIPQVVTLREALAEAGFAMAETLEVLQRGWHIEGKSVRPDHRMVAHTGFLTAARLMALGS
ncbi:MAG TPA: tRNA (adenine-N1)-methyltransferase [Acidimicrobiales bacterium]|nr:tRNA (adenine-N1)-methyltransferase [Acidimicrobiales bacterium]